MPYTIVIKGVTLSVDQLSPLQGRGQGYRNFDVALGA